MAVKSKLILIIILAGVLGFNVFQFPSIRGILADAKEILLRNHYPDGAAVNKTENSAAPMASAPLSNECGEQRGQAENPRRLGRLLVLDSIFNGNGPSGGSSRLGKLIILEGLVERPEEFSRLEKLIILDGLFEVDPRQRTPDPDRLGKLIVLDGIFCR